jgi:hypothetical protein
MIEYAVSIHEMYNKDKVSLLNDKNKLFQIN